MPHREEKHLLGQLAHLLEQTANLCGLIFSRYRRQGSATAEQKSLQADARWAIANSQASFQRYVQEGYHHPATVEALLTLLTANQQCLDSLVLLSHHQPQFLLPSLLRVDRIIQQFQASLQQMAQVLRQGSPLAPLPALDANYQALADDHHHLQEQRRQELAQHKTHTLLQSRIMDESLIVAQLLSMGDALTMLHGAIARLTAD